MILDKINYPSDLKNLSFTEMDELAGEIREAIINKVNVTGGHFGPNLGIVEATIAMHYVFDAPKDKFIFDVSHQCYPHKILTGRKECFTDSGNYYKFTGYTAPEEGEYDLFKIGHTSTSVSLATGVAKARDLKGESYNIIALIGDGSLSGGEALEGLNNGAVLGTNFIVIVNDNDQSIAENHGGLYDNLRELRENNGVCKNNFFKSIGYDYCFVKNGNDIKSLIETFTKVKNINHPIVVHIYTQKGKGYKPAEEDKEPFHWVLPGVLNVKNDNEVCKPEESYNSITNDYILNKSAADKTLIAINAGTPGVFGWNKQFRDKLGKQYTDVGIAEEHACAYASALAKSGAKPIWAVMSSFVQRTYDQLSQDLCLNNSPITMLVHWGGISGADATHLCTFDIPLIKNIPNMVYLAPTYKEEYLQMLNWAVEQNKYPVAIRVPNIELISKGEDNTDYSVLNKYKVTQYGEKVAILGLGNFYPLAEKVANTISEKLGFTPTIINPRFITGVDTELMESVKLNHKLVITLEDGQLDGGFGEMISRFYGKSDVRVLNYGSHKEFTDRVQTDELFTKYRLKPELILEDVKYFL